MRDGKKMSDVCFARSFETTINKATSYFLPVVRLSPF